MRCRQTVTTGYRYAEMGYTACFEPAMLPANARQAHMEMGDTPMVDKGAFVMLGNDDFFLRLLGDGEGPRNDQGLHRLDDARGSGDRRQGGQSRRHQRVQVQSAQAGSRRGAMLYYGVTPRQIILSLARAAEGIGSNASTPHSWLQSRRSRQYGNDARHHPGRRRPAAST